MVDKAILGGVIFYLVSTVILLWPIQNQDPVTRRKNIIVIILAVLALIYILWGVTAKGVM